MEIIHSFSGSQDGAIWPSWPICFVLVENRKKNVLKNYFALTLTKDNESLTEIRLRLSNMQYGAVWPIGPSWPIWPVLGENRQKMFYNTILL